MSTEKIVRLAGTVIELHPKSGPNWTRAYVQTLDEFVWLTAKFQLQLGDTVEVDAVFNAKFRSYDAKKLITGKEISNTVVQLQLIQRVPGLGKIKAKVLAEAFPKLWDALQNNLDAVAAKAGLSKEVFSECIEAIQAQGASLGRVSELVNLGYPVRIAKIVAEQDSLYVVALKGPYGLIPYVHGLGWKVAEEIGQTMRIDANDPARVGAAIQYIWTIVLNEGHTIAPRKAVLEGLYKLDINVGDDAVGKVINESTIPIDTPDHPDYVTTRASLSRAEIIRNFFLKNKR